MSNTARTILAIDTSCDDTSAAVTHGFEVWSNMIASQTQLHRQYGGVFPTVAKQAHKENIMPTIAAALKRARVTWDNIDAIAITQGPGLAPALEVGIAAAQQLAAEHHLPIIPINHMEGHALSVLAVARDHEAPTVKPNSLAVVVSGGHTEFILIKSLGKYERLGWTVDDAAGEVLDKVGRMLDLGYPAGPVIEEFAKLGSDHAFEFPLPMTTSRDFNLSFSGLKTAARNKLEDLEAQNHLTKTQIYNFSASFQKAVFRSITYKLNKILLKYQINEIWLGGGVACNMTLRRKMRQAIKPYGLELRVPYSKKLCTDNAAMIGIAASLHSPITEKIERLPKWEISN